MTKFETNFVRALDEIAPTEVRWLHSDTMSDRRRLKYETRITADIRVKTCSLRAIGIENDLSGKHQRVGKRHEARSRPRVRRGRFNRRN